MSFAIIVPIKKFYSKIEWTPIQIARESYSVFKRIVDKRFLIKQLLAQGVSLLVSNYFTYKVSELLNSIFTQISNKEFLLLSEAGAKENSSGASLDNFKTNLIATIPFFAISIGVGISSSVINGYFSRRLARQLIDRVKEIKANNQNAYGVTHNPEVDLISRDLGSNIYQLTDSINLLSSSFSVLQNAALSIGVLFHHSQPLSLGIFRAPDLIFYSFVYGYTIQFIGGVIDKKISTLERLLQEKQVIYNQVASYDAANIKTIEERGLAYYSYQRDLKLSEDLRRIYNQKALFWEPVSKAWNKFHLYANRYFKYILIGSRLYNQTLTLENYALVEYSVDNVEPFFTWRADNLPSILTFRTAKAKIEKFLDEVDKLNSVHYSLKRIVQQGDFAVKVEEFSITIKGTRELVNIPHYEFLKGERYLITGESGHGKSTFLSKIVGLKHSGDIWAEGKIYIGCSKIAFLTQQDYIPVRVSLLEAMCFEKAPDESKIQKIKQMMKEIKIDDVSEEDKDNGIIAISNQLGQVKDWNTCLSGGQKKKIQLISQILNEPDLLVLDESFAALDEMSIASVHNLIMNYLHKATILLVDHGGVAHNELSGRKFCNINLHFQNHKMVEMSI